MDNEPTKIDAAPKTNDLILVVGPNEERIPASSAILTAASPVFASMLSPLWKESRTKEISLPADGPDAMRFIALTLSCQNQHEFVVAKQRKPREILQIVIAADKYDMCTALKFVLYYLFNEASKVYTLDNTKLPTDASGHSGEDIAYLCAAAYLLDNCEYFNKFSLYLMCSRKKPFHNLMDDELINSIIPAKFFVTLADNFAFFPLAMSQALKKFVAKSGVFNYCNCLSRKRYEQLGDEFGTSIYILSAIKRFLNLLRKERFLLDEICVSRMITHRSLTGEKGTLRACFFLQNIESFQAEFCIRKLKGISDCNAEHAKLSD